MKKVEEAKGFLEMLTNLNKTQIEIKTVLKYLNEIEAEQLNLNSSSLQLPCEDEMVMKRHYEFKKMKERLPNIESGGFYVGFRSCFNWLKPYEVDDKAIV